MRRYRAHTLALCIITLTTFATNAGDQALEESDIERCDVRLGAKGIKTPMGSSLSEAVLIHSPTVGRYN